MRDWYEKYLKPNQRGYLLIHNFHARNLQRFRNTDLEDPQAMVHQVYLALENIHIHELEGPEENYVMRTITYQCWKILEREAVRQNRVSSGELQEDGMDSWISDEPTPDEEYSRSELYEHICLFRASLSRQDQAIVNALLTGKPLSDVAGKFHMTTNVIRVRASRIRKKLEAYLRICGLME